MRKLPDFFGPKLRNIRSVASCFPYPTYHAQINLEPRNANLPVLKIAKMSLQQIFSGFSRIMKSLVVLLGTRAFYVSYVTTVFLTKHFHNPRVQKSPNL